MLCLRIFTFILILWLYMSWIANGRQQKLSPEESKYFSRENKSYNNPLSYVTETVNGEPYNYVDVYHQSLLENHSYIHQIEMPSIETDQTEREGGLLGSTTARKTLIVWMKSLASDTRGLTVYDSGKLIYRFDTYVEKSSQTVRILDLLGEVAYTICRKRYLIARPWWEGYKGSQRSSRATFRVKERPNHDSLDTKSTWCMVNKYDDSSYTLQPCRIPKSSNVKLGFKLINVEGQTIAELKQRHGDGEVPLGRDVFNLDVEAEAEADIPFVVALVAVFGMINHKF